MSEWHLPDDCVIMTRVEADHLWALERAVRQTIMNQITDEDTWLMIGRRGLDVLREAMRRAS